MKEAFEKRILTGKVSIALDSRTWTADKATIVRDIINITNNYAQQGYRLTLRQLYYQLVAADWSKDGPNQTIQTSPQPGED